MIKVNDKKWSSLEDEQKIAYCKDNLVSPAKEERRNYDWNWYMNTQFLQGNHYVFYNSVTNAIETPPRKRNSVRLVVNKVKATVRSVLNYSTRFQPRFEPIPGDTDPETIDNARRSGKILDYLHYKLYLRSKIRKLVRNSIITSVGFWELGWDDSAEDGMGQVVVTNHDPFDIFIPASAFLDGPIIHSPFIAKVTTVSVDEIKADERYDETARGKVKPDEELALSDMKARILRKEGMKSDRKEGQETALRYEMMLYDPEGNEAGGNIQLFTFVGDQVLRDEELKDKEFPIYVFQEDNSVSRVYSDAWIEGLVPLNKALDRAESQILEYDNQLLRARIIADVGHGVNLAATGRSGSDVEVLEVNAGRRFEQFSMSPLPLTIHRQIDNLNRYIEDVGGAHEASLGVNPAGGRSGKVLEALQAADSNNLAGIRESLEDFLSVIGSRILDIVSEKWVASRVVKIADPEEGGSQFLKVIGAGAASKPKDATIINKDNEVQVRIGSWLGHTREAQRETLIELGSAGFIPKDEVLRQFEFANVEELSAKARKERLEESEMKADIAGRRGQGGQGAQGGGQAGGIDMVGLADDENMRIMNGEQLAPTPGATPEHTQAHLDFMQSPDAQQNQQGLMMIDQHARGELGGG